MIGVADSEVKQEKKAIRAAEERRMLWYSVAAGGSFLALVGLVFGLIAWLGGQKEPNAKPPIVKKDDGPTKFAEIDLLKLIDVDRDSVKGKWKMENGVLVSPDDIGLLHIPFSPPDEYELDLVVEGGKRCDFVLVTGDSQCCVILQGASGSGLDLVDGKTYK